MSGSVPLSGSDKGPHRSTMQAWMRSLGISMALSLLAGCGESFDPTVVCSLALGGGQGAEGFGTLPVGNTLQLTLHASDCQMNSVQVPVSEITFSSRDTPIAEVTRTGLVTAKGVGATVLGAEVGTKSAAFLLIVTQ